MILGFCYNKETVEEQLSFDERQSVNSISLEGHKEEMILLQMRKQTQPKMITRILVFKDNCVVLPFSRCQNGMRLRPKV